MTEEIFIVTAGKADVPDEGQDEVLVRLLQHFNKKDGWQFAQYLGFDPETRHHKVMLKRERSILAGPDGQPISKFIT